MEDAFTELKVKIAELGTELKNVSHDVKGALMEMKAFATIREMDAMKADFLAKLLASEKSTDDKRLAQDKVLGDRITAVEGVITWAGRIIVGSVLLAVVGLVMAAQTKIGIIK